MQNLLINLGCNSFLTIKNLKKEVKKYIHEDVVDEFKPLILDNDLRIYMAPTKQYIVFIADNGYEVSVVCIVSKDSIKDNFPKFYGTGSIGRIEFNNYNDSIPFTKSVASLQSIIDKLIEYTLSSKNPINDKYTWEIKSI